MTDTISVPRKLAEDAAELIGRMTYTPLGAGTRAGLLRILRADEQQAVPVAQDEREATVEIHIPQYIGRAKSDKLVDAVCRAITKHDIEFTRVKLVHPDRAALSAATPSADVPVALTDDDWQAVADELDSIIFSRVRQAIDKRLAEKQQCK